jgi:transcriptional regulator with XRE-family HTH domain
MDAKSSDREKQICERLRQFRESLQIPRTRFALSIGVTDAALAGYELGRARVRYETFGAVQKRFSVNPVWLATGKENLVLFNWSDEKIRAMVKPREIFSRAYDRLIAPQLHCERVNKSGTLASAKVAKDWFAALPRFKKARCASGVSLEELARKLDSINFSLGTAKDLKRIEDGKKYPGARAVATLLDVLGICEDWLWTGKGKWSLSAGKVPVGNSREGCDGLSDLRHLLAEVRENMARITSNLDALETALSRQEKTAVSSESCASRSLLSPVVSSDL